MQFMYAQPTRDVHNMPEKQDREVKVKKKMRKRDKAVVAISEAMGIQLAADAMCIEDLQGFPDLANESKKNQAIMCMTACGFPQTHIAEAFKLAQPTVHEIIHRIDPDGMFKISKNAKKAFITKLAEGRAMSAISSISYEDLLDLNAKDRTSVAKDMMKISQDLNVSKHKELGGTKMDMLLEQMAAEAEEAEFVEIKEESK